MFIFLLVFFYKQRHPIKTIYISIVAGYDVFSNYVDK